jgi:hypothetical protein
VNRTFPFLIVPKASKSEKNAGLDGLEDKEMYYKDGRGNALETFCNPEHQAKSGRKPPEPRKNHHPTCKPIKLMSYLIAIGSRPGDAVLDPYAGTCTTGIAAALLDRRYICIEQDADGDGWCDIGERRIAWHVEQAKAEKEAQLDMFMIQRMPADVTVCTDARDVRRCAKDMDVVLLELRGLVDYGDRLSFLNELPVFVAGFHLDSWKGPYWCDADVEVDLNICIYRDVTFSVKPKIAEDDSFLWLPPRVQLYDMESERDIDVISWGHMGREYPFRNFAFFALQCILKHGPRVEGSHIRYEYDRLLRFNPITLGGHDYAMGRIEARYGGQRGHGRELADILLRSRICPTGPPIQGSGGITTEFSEMNDLGFEHGKNIWITTAEKFFSDLEYLLTDRGRCLEISQNARALVEQRHTVGIRAGQLYEELRNRTGIIRKGNGECRINLN